MFWWLPMGGSCVGALVCNGFAGMVGVAAVLPRVAPRVRSLVLPRSSSLVIVVWLVLRDSTQAMSQEQYSQQKASK